MEVGFVKRQIKNKELNKFYIFTGDEIKAQSIYVHKIAEVANKPLQLIEHVSDIAKNGKSLFAKPKCYWCQDDSDFLKTETAWDKVESIIGENTLILSLTTLDKRSKFYKRFSDDIVVFDYMKSDTLKKYIQRDCDLNDTNCNQLIQVCENDYSRILFELDKINRYSKVMNISNDRAFRDLLSDGAIHIPPQDAIFDFVDAVLSGKCIESFRLLQDCYAINEPALRLITVLYSNCKKLLQVQACPDKDIEKSTGLTSWDIKCVQKWVDCWSIGDLVYFLKLFSSAEKALKTGDIEEQYLMDYLMVNIF